MTHEQLIARIRTIRETNPGNLMARHFDEDYFRALDDPSRKRLRRIIISGIENSDSQMGAYAMNPEDYDRFSPMLDPMIRDFHGIPAQTAIAHKADWDTGAMSCDLAAIDSCLKDVSMRVRVARNVSTFPLPGAMSKEQRVALENIAAQLIKDAANRTNFLAGDGTSGSIVLARAIVKQGWKAIEALVDTSLPVKKLKMLNEIILEVKGVERVNYIKSRQLGKHYWLDVEIQVSPDLLVREGNIILKVVKYELMKISDRIKDVVVILACRNPQDRLLGEEKAKFA